MYKKFIGLVFFIVIILYASYSYFVLNYKILYLDQEYPMWLQVKNIINNTTSNKIDLMIIGDSRAKAGFIPNELKIKSINLSLGGASPIEGFFTLKKYLKNNPKPTHIIFSYTPTHLANDSYYWSRTVPFEFLMDSNYKEIELLAHKMNEKPIIKNNKRYTDYKYPKSYASSFKNGIIGRRWLKNKIVLKKCQISKGHYYFGIKNGDNGLNKETSQSKFKKSKLQEYYFNKLLTLAKSNYIKLYYYNMPFNKSSFSKVNNNYINEYNTYINKLSVKYNMKQCNNIFYMENSNFGDASHLFKGAKYNTFKIYECILK